MMCSAVNGFATAAEFAGLAVGLGYGIVLTRRAGTERPATRLVGAAIAATVVMAVAFPRCRSEISQT